MARSSAEVAESMNPANFDEPFFTLKELPPQVEAAKRELTHGRVMVITAADKHVAVSAALALTLEVQAKSSMVARACDCVKMIQEWTIDKVGTLNNYDGSFQAPVLAFYFVGAEFFDLFDAQGYRMDELRNWMKLRMADRIRKNLVTIIAATPELALPTPKFHNLFGSYGTLQERFITVALKGGKKK